MERTKRRRGKHTHNPLVATAWKIPEETPQPWPVQHIRPKTVGQASNNRTGLAQICDIAKTNWIIGRSNDTFTNALEELGGETLFTAATSKKEYWQITHHDLPNIKTFASRLHKKVPPVQWLIVTNVQE